MRLTARGIMCSSEHAGKFGGALLLERRYETVRETERFEIQIKTLSKDGVIRVLSGAQTP